jgi:branched-chain amino acid transport system permease protein
MIEVDNLSLTLLLQAAMNGLLLGLIYSLISVGLSLTLGVMGIINVAHSTFIMLGSFMALELFRRFNLDPIVSVFIAAPLFFLVGAVVQRSLVQRINQSTPLSGLLILFGLLVVIESSSILVWTTDSRLITTSYSNINFNFGDFTLSAARLVAGGLALLLVGLMHFFLQNTMPGKAVRAMAQSRDAARVLGINTERMAMLVFGLGTASAAVGGVVLTLIFPFAPQDHTRWLSWAFLVVIVGGLGSVKNTLIAGLTIGMVETISGVLLPFQYVYLVVYSLLVLALLLRGQGLAGNQSRTI